jgi:hypothetical protein
LFKDLVLRAALDGCSKAFAKNGLVRLDGKDNKLSTFIYFRDVFKDEFKGFKISISWDDRYIIIEW